MEKQKSLFRVVRELPKSLPTSTSPDAKWGITSILFSISLFLLPLSLSFWAISLSLEGGQIMLPSSLVSWIFAGLAVVSFLAWIGISIIALRLAFHWYRISPSITDTSQQLNDIKTSINNLTDEIRRDRNERNKSK